MIYSTKKNLFLIFFECRGATSEVVLYRDHVDMHNQTERVNTIIGTRELGYFLVGTQ